MTNSRFNIILEKNIFSSFSSSFFFFLDYIVADIKRQTMLTHLYSRTRAYLRSFLHPRDFVSYYF